MAGLGRRLIESVYFWGQQKGLVSRANLLLVSWSVCSSSISLGNLTVAAARNGDAWFEQLQYTMYWLPSLSIGPESTVSGYMYVYVCIYICIYICVFVFHTSRHASLTSVVVPPVTSTPKVPKVLDELQQRIQAFREARPMVANDLEPQLQTKNSAENGPLENRNIYKPSTLARVQNLS